jgi:hypothetical protein
MEPGITPKCNIREFTQRIHLVSPLGNVKPGEIRLSPGGFVFDNFYLSTPLTIAVANGVSKWFPVAE